VNAVVRPTYTAPPESRYKTAMTRLQELKQERLSWDSHWRELQDFFLTRRGRWITDSKTNAGTKRNQKLVDPSPKFAARTLGAGMHAGSTNPATPWFRLVTPDPEMMEYPAVSQWLYAVENRMRDVFSRSNLYSVLPSLYTEAGVFGTGPMILLDHPTKVIHCVPKTVGSYYLATNSDGVIDTMYCEYKLTVRQLVGDYGLDKVSATVKNEWDSGRRHVLHDVLHVIEPNKDRIAGAYDNKNMAFSSVYFETQGTGSTARGDMLPLRVSGFEDNPIAAFRWETTELTDAYGSSCGMDALGLAKALQVQTKNKAKAVDKLVDPPMVGDPALKNQPSSLLPGDVTWSGFTANGSAPKFQPAYIIKPELQYLLQDIQDSREIIDVAMYVNLFLAITKADPRNATVPEIDARKEEQILALGPVLQNHELGLITPIIDRTFNIMARKGLLPPPPQELSGVQLKVELIGALAQAFRSIAGGKIERFAGFVGNIAAAQAAAGQEVTAFDKFDVDQALDEHSQALGVPPSIVRGDDVVAQMREQRAQQQAQQQSMQAMAAAKDGATAAKTLSETDTGNGQNALQAVAGAV
jgi:hypothetical protein